MKKVLSIVALFFAIHFAYAQLPANSFAPDFTLLPVNPTTLTLDTDNPVHLYEYLDAGKPTVLDFSAVWCAPCWNYHTSGVLETAYNSYGPNGTDQLRVVYLEGDAGTIANLNGSGGNTQGNWITGTPYPIIPTAVSPNTNAVVSNYSIGYFPTVYMVCPNRIVNEIGQLSSATAILSAAQACPQFDNTLTNNAGIIKISKPTSVNFCSVVPEITLQNLGSATLTAATFTLNLDGTETTYDWTGSLTQYALGTISLPELTNLTPGSHTYNITINTVNGVVDTDAALNTISKTFDFQNVGQSSTVSEDFSSSVFPATGWGLTNNYWVRYSSNQAIYFDGYQISDGEWDELSLPLVDLSGVNNPAITFDVAHARYGTSNEKLEVMVSSCSSSNWVTLYNKSGASLATAAATSNQYLPGSSSEWRREEVDLSQFAGNNAVRIKFKATSNYGNVIWLDNIAVTTASSITENDVINSSIYPNPVSDNLYIKADENIQQVSIFNVQGQVIKTAGNVSEIAVSDLAPGFYFLQVTTDSGVTTHKFTKK